MRVMRSIVLAGIFCATAFAQEPGTGTQTPATRAQVPGAETSHPKIVTATRPVVMFGHIERELLGAIQQKKLEPIKATVAADFEMLKPTPPGEPVILNSWLEEIAKAPQIAAFRTSQMAVHLIGNDTAMVSFVQSVKLDEKTPKFEDTFMVDYWSNESGVWKLKVRYASPVHDYPHPEPPKTTGKQ